MRYMIDETKMYINDGFRVMFTDTEAHFLETLAESAISCLYADKNSEKYVRTKHFAMPGIDLWKCVHCHHLITENIQYELHPANAFTTTTNLRRHQVVSNFCQLWELRRFLEPPQKCFFGAAASLVNISVDILQDNNGKIIFKRSASK